jgi:gamma-glutamylcyclotransferase
VTADGGRVLYFAYGANIHPGWLWRRIPDAPLLGAGALPGYRLEFRKRGRDGAARSDACPSGDPAARLPGALYSVSAPDLGLLGAASAGYRTLEVIVESGKGPRPALTWVAEPAEIVHGLLPWDWYLALIRAGARRLNLDEAHRRWLAGVPTLPDPDAGRAALARAVLAGDPNAPD